MRGGALRYYRPQGQRGRGFGGLLKRGLKRDLQLIKPHARKAFFLHAHKKAVKYVKEEGIPFRERYARQKYPELKRRALNVIGDQSGGGLHRRRKRKRRKRSGIFTY